MFSYRGAMITLLLYSFLNFQSLHHQSLLKEYTYGVSHLLILGKFGKHAEIEEINLLEHSDKILNDTSAR